MAINKVIFGGNTLIDLTEDTITAADVQAGVIFHLPSGATGVGVNTADSDTSEATAVASEILSGKTAFARSNELTGTMPNRGSVTGTITTKSELYTIQQGYHDGGGNVSIDEIEQAKIIAGNIKSGIEILGVTGTYSGDEIAVQSKTATPTTSAQTILPDVGYDYLSQVSIAAIPYVETPNASGGNTATIG